MSEVNSNDIDAADVCDQVAALAAHLSGRGVRYLPNSDPAQVELIRSQLRFESSSETVATSTADTTPKAATASESTASVATASATTPREATEKATAASGVKRASTAQAASGLFALDGGDATTDYPGERLESAARQERLVTMSEQVASCTRCEMLAQCRTKTVFGEGSATPRFTFFGEGPGREEDLSGRPFVGKAGQLLTKMIEACKLSRDDVYIMNTVKCRPPNNRNPEPAEIQNCREYFEGQLNVLRPEYIVCLGLVAAKALLPNTPSVGRMRGRLHPYFGSKVLVTYHPSYLLRTPAAKKAAWEDLQLMLRDAGML